MEFVEASSAFFDHVYFHNSVTTWLSAIILFGFLLPAFLFLRRSLATWLARIGKNMHGDIHEFLSGVISKTKFIFILIAALSMGVLLLDLPQNVHHLIRCVFIVALWTQIGLWGTEVIRFFLNRMMHKQDKDGNPDPSLLMTVNVLEFVCRLILFVLITLLILDNLGFNITTLIAGLGVGGIAIALAVQNILGDLFASLSIVLDKPFVLGDRIIVGTDEGYVEKIGLKTTRLVALSGEQIICANADLLRSRIRNFRRMRERRIVVQVRVTLSTSNENLAKIPDLLKEIVEAQKLTRFDRAHFKSFGDFFYSFELAYFVQSPDFKIYVEIENAVNLTLVSRFRALGIEFAHNP